MQKAPMQKAWMIDASPPAKPLSARVVCGGQIRCWTVPSGDMQLDSP